MIRIVDRMTQSKLKEKINQNTWWIIKKYQAIGELKQTLRDRESEIVALVKENEQLEDALNFKEVMEEYDGQ